MLLVDETRIRRRHHYVTVVACGESGKVLAMIPGRTKGSLARFFRDQGSWWCQQVEIVVSDGSRSYQSLYTCLCEVGFSIRGWCEPALRGDDVYD